MRTSSNIIAVAGSVLLLMTGHAAHGQDHSLQPVEKLSVVDSRGKLVGNVVGMPPWGSGAGPIVAFGYGGRLLFAGVHSKGFEGYPQLFFQSTDCTGTIYSPDFDDPNRPPLVQTIVIFGTKVYEPSAPAVDVRINSYLENSSGVALCLPIEMQQPVKPMQFVVDLSSLVTPPFRLK